MEDDSNQIKQEHEQEAAADPLEAVNDGEDNADLENGEDDDDDEDDIAEMIEILKNLDFVLAVKTNEKAILGKHINSKERKNFMNRLKTERQKTKDKQTKKEDHKDPTKV